MTVEEMAEDCWRSKELGYKVCADERSYKTGFADGLKAGRPQWHDLRKDPNDVPSDYRSVWTNKGGACYVKDGWYDDCGHVIGVIAWCEPKYEE